MLPNTRKIVLSVSALLLIAIIFLYFVPVKRTFNGKLSMQASPTVVYQGLLKNTEWNSWYFDRYNHKHYRLTIKPVKQDESVSFNIDEKGVRNISGTFKINISLEGGSFLEWNNTVNLLKGLGEKIQLLLWPSSYEAIISNSLLKLKDKLDKPAEIDAGVRFKVYQMKGHAIAAINDTVSLAKAEQKIIQLYQKIRSQISPVAFTDTNRLTSRYELITDSIIDLEVGLRMKDATMIIPSPLKRLEVPSVLIFIASAKANYQQSEEAVQITHDWVKKYHLKLASPFWFEHNIKLQNGKYQLGDTLHIIQPFYYWLHPVEDTY